MGMGMGMGMGKVQGKVQGGGDKAVGWILPIPTSRQHRIQCFKGTKLPRYVGMRKLHSRFPLDTSTTTKVPGCGEWGRMVMGASSPTLGGGVHHHRHHRRRGIGSSGTQLVVPYPTRAASQWPIPSARN